MGDRMVIVVNGKLVYRPLQSYRPAFATASRLVMAKSISSTDCSEMDGHEVSDGDWLSEAALWTKWEHNGELITISDCALLFVDSAGFLRLMTAHPPAHVSCLRYAREFVEFFKANMQSDLHNCSFLPKSLNRTYLG